MNQELLLRKNGEKISPMRAAWPFWCFLALAVLALVPLLLDAVPQRDVAFRYAPMAEAFRDGDFTYAFHPRTGFLHTFTAGIFAWILGCGGFTACKISSMLFMGLGIFPLYAIMRRVYSRSMAEICTFIFVLASQLQRLGWSGLRDSHKTFLILLAGYALLVIYQERRKWTGYICLGIAAGLGIVTRGDLVLIMSLVFFWGIVMELELKGFPWRSLAGSILAVMLALPAIVLNWYLAGVAVPEIRFAWLFRKVMHRYPGLTDTLPLIGLGIFFAFLAAWAVRKIIAAGRGKILAGVVLAGLLAAAVRQIFSPDFYLEVPVRVYLGSIFKGFFPVFAVVGLVGIGFRVARKEWTKEESILAVLLFGHAILVCAQIILNDCFLYVSSRYLVPAVPLEFGWSVLGILALWELLTAKIRIKHPVLVQNVGYLAFVLTVCGFLYDFYNPVMREYVTAGRKQRQFHAALHGISGAIRRDYKGPAEFRPEVDAGAYIPKYNPAILYLKYRENKKLLLPDSGRIIVSAYFARGRVAGKLQEADYVVEKYSPDNRIPDHLVLLETVDSGKEKYRVWKKIR